MSWEERVIRSPTASPSLNRRPSATFLSVPSVILGDIILNELKLCFDDIRVERMGLIYSEANPWYQFYNQKHILKVMHIC